MNNEFWRDQQMDTIIESIVNIFTSVEGVELVRLKGLTKYLNKISGKELSFNEIQMIISKLNVANIIDYEYETHCPHCNEISYIIIPKSELTKLCDTCNTFYQLVPGQTLFANITRK